MATTGYRFPTSDAAVSGSWTNPTNVQADDTSYALCDISAKNTTAEREQGNFGFSTAVLPEAATITQVNLQVVWKLTTDASVIANLGTRAGVSAGYGALHEDSTEPIADVTRTYDITSERSWVPANMRDGTFTTRLQGRNGNDASNPGYLFDYVAVEVVYTTTEDFPQTIAATQVGVGTVGKATTFPRTLAATMIGAATVGTAVSFGQSIAASVVAAVTLASAVSFGQSIAASAVGTATITRLLSLSATIAATATQIVTIVRNTGKSIAATVVGVAVVDTEYQGPGGGGGGGVKKLITVLFTRARRHS